MAAYYNEFNPEAAAWLRELIKRKLIVDGEVDERSIIDVQANDIRGFSQCHFFAGIGGWSYALRLAGIPDDYPCWTASLPCQPFSAAGKQLGKDDERHLLPHFTELVKQCKPNRIFGEQVEGAIRHGWLDDLQTTMEAENYAVGHCVLGAHSVGAYHQRQRLYWVAQRELGDTLHDRARRTTRSKMGASQDDKRAAESEGQGGARDGVAFGGASPFNELPDPASTRLEGRKRQGIQGRGAGFAVSGSGLGNTKHDGHNANQIGRGLSESEIESGMLKFEGSDTEWSDPYWIYCRDKKYRPIESSIKPLVNGIPKGVVRGGNISEEFDANNTQEARAMRLKGYGNAIVPQVAAMFISAFMEAQ
jgi:DNA (cytosine-5)-methyltransferase 1